MDVFCLVNHSYFPVGDSLTEDVSVGKTRPDRISALNFPLVNINAYSIPEVNNTSHVGLLTSWLLALYAPRNCSKVTANLVEW